MLKKFLSLLAVVCGLTTPASAATSTYTVYSTAGSIVCGSDAVCSTINHLSVRTVTISGTAGTALYTWNGTCPSSPDSVFYIRPTGATTGCFVLEGFAPATSTGVSSVTGTTNQITSSPTSGAVVLSLPSSLIAPGTISSTSLNVSGSTPSANGLYLPSANTLGISVNSLQVGRFTSTGLNATNIGVTTAGSGAFTTLSTTGALTYGGVTLTNSVTGTGSMVLSAGPTFTGVPSAPTVGAGTNTTQLATTAFVQSLSSPYFLVSLSSNQAQASGAVPFDTVTYDPSGICSTVTHKCTPTVAGKYIFYCQVTINSTTGPSINGNLSDARIHVNTTDISDMPIKAQVAILSSPSATSVTSQIIQMNGTTDTVECDSANNGVSPVAVGGSSATYFYGHRLGA